MDNKIDIEKIKNAQTIGRLGRSEGVRYSQGHILLIEIINAIKVLRGIKKVAFCGEDIYLNKNILFHNMDYEEINGLLNVDKSKKYQLYIAGFPFGLRMEKYYDLSEEDRNKLIPRIDSSTNLIIEHADIIDEDGFGLFITLNYNKVFVIDKIREHLLKKNYYVNGIIGLPKEFLHPYTGIPTQAIIISKNKTDKEFILNIDSVKSFNLDLGSMFSDIKSDKNSIFVDKCYEDINRGIWVKPGNFKGFEDYKHRKELESIDTDLATFETKKLEDLCLDMNTCGHGKQFENLDNAVYTSLIGTHYSCTSIEQLGKKKPQNYIQLIIDPNTILKSYLSYFLNSYLGKKQLEILTSQIGGIIPRLNKSRLKKFEVRVPTVKVQKEIMSAIEKSELMKRKIDELIQNILKNPMSDSKSLDQIDSVIKSMSILTDTDKIKNLINSDESKTTEFKQTVTFDIRKKDRNPVIQEMWVKTVAAFLNTDGGDLLIGVSNNKEITGMNFEMEKFFKKGGNYQDNLMLHVKNVLKDKIGAEFYPLIDAKLVSVDRDFVLWINCKASDKAVYVGDDFYVRTHPATDKLTGQAMVEYVNRRFLKL